ncbi:unnamed protein product [Aureobasidium vineae]|uniref:Uncharacterized protein n=1 Tax=Aureobasidium vineae TaxID=2773715 RepID=A0A9N8PE57_9PEZI|nr:unnamed protein product [Aureobasidium vineae]
MRAIAIALSCLAGLSAVQATSLVTVVKTVIEDKAVYRVDISTPALDGKVKSELAEINRRNEDDSPGSTTMTRIWITSPYTTNFEIPITQNPSDKPKSETTDDEEGWEDLTETPTPTPTTPDEVIETITRSQSPAGAPVRNTVIPNIPPSAAAPTLTDIPSNWPPKVGPNADPNEQPPLFPEIVNPGYVPKPPPTPVRWCDIYPYPDSDCETMPTVTPTP